MTNTTAIASTAKKSKSTPSVVSTLYVAKVQNGLIDGCFLDNSKVQGIAHDIKNNTIPKEESALVHLFTDKFNYLFLIEEGKIISQNRCENFKLDQNGEMAIPAIKNPNETVCAVIDGEIFMMNQITYQAFISKYDNELSYTENKPDGDFVWNVKTRAYLSLSDNGTSLRSALVKSGNRVYSPKFVSDYYIVENKEKTVELLYNTTPLASDKVLFSGGNVTKAEADKSFKTFLKDAQMSEKNNKLVAKVAEVETPAVKVEILDEEKTPEITIGLVYGGA